MSLYVPLPDHARQPAQDTSKTQKPAPSLSRSVSASAQESRPQLARLRTADMHLPQTHEARAAFASGNFADPARKKAKVFDLGAPLLTEAHERLIFALREECARLHNYSRHLANKVTDMGALLNGAQGALQEARDSGLAVKEHNRRLLAANQALVQDLKTATDSLQEVDAMFLNVSKKRMSRLSEASQVHPQDMGLEVDPPLRPLSPTPNRSMGRSAVSLDAANPASLIN